MEVSFSGKILNDVTREYKDAKSGEFQKKRTLMVLPNGSDAVIKLKVPLLAVFSEGSLYDFEKVRINVWEMNGKSGVSFSTEDMGDGKTRKSVK